MVRFEQIGIAIVFFGLVILLGSTLLTEVNVNYNLNADTSVYDNYTQTVNRVRNVAEEGRNTTQLSTTTEETTDGELYKGQVKTTLKVWDMIPIVKNSIELMSKTFNLPIFFIESFYTILTLIGVAFGLYMIMRFKPQKD